MVTDLCQPMFDQHFVDWIHEEGRVAGCRVRRVGGLFIEVHKMAYNLRVVVTDALLPAGGQWYAFCGYAWCYPSELGYPAVADFVWDWDFDPSAPDAVHPPGPWIKAVHSQIYRVPGHGQAGPDIGEST